MAENANISEIIEIKIDIPAFKKNLKDAEAAYDEFIQSINKAGNNVKVGKTGAQFSFIADNIKQLTAIMAQQSEIFSNALDQFTGKTAASAEKSTKTLEQAISKAKTLAKENIFGPGNDSGEEEFDKVVKTRKALEEDANKRRKELADRFKGDLSERLRAQQAAEKFATATKLKEIEADVKVAKSAQEAAAKIVAAEEKIIAAKGKTLLKFQQLKQSYERLGKDLPISTEARVANSIDFSGSKAPQADRQADLANTLRYLGQQEKAVSEAFKNNQKVAQGFFDKLTGNFAASAGTAIKYALVFKAFSATIQGLTTLISTPFLILQKGIEYQKQLEGDYTNIQRALLRNSEFSKDAAENFRLSREYAKELAINLEKVAGELGVEEKLLQNITTLTIESGGQKFLKSQDDLVKFSKLYAAAVKNVVTDTEGGSLALAASVNELADVFSSNGKGLDQNKFLKGLDLTVAQWIKIRDSAKDTRDLMQKLGPQAEIIFLAIDKTQNVFGRISKQLEIIVARLFGLGAEEIFEEITKALAQLFRFLEDNQDKFVGFFYAVNSILLASANTLKDIILSLEPFIPFLQMAAKFATYLAAGIHSAVLGFIALTKIQAAPLAGSGALDVIKSAVIDLQKELKQTATAYGNLIDAIDGKFVGNKKTPTPDPRPLKDPRPDVTKTAGLAGKDFEEARSKIQVQVELVKEKYNELREAEIEAEQERLISRKELADSIADLNAKEIAELDSFYAKIQAASVKATALALSTEVDPVKRAEIQKRFSTLFYQTELQRLKDSESLRRLARQYDRQAAKESFDIKQEELRTELALEEKGLELKRDLIKAEFDAGLRTRTEVADAEEAVETKALSNRKRLLEDNIKTIAKDHADRVKLEKELEVLLQEISDRAKIRQKNTEKAQNEDRQSTENHITKLRELVARSEQDRLTFFNQLSGDSRFTLQLEKVLSLRQQDLKLAEEQKAAEVARFRAMKDGTDQANRLEEELITLGQARFNNLQQRVENLNNTNTGSLGATLRKVLLRKALKEAELRQQEVVNSEVTFGDEAGATAKALLLTNASKAVSDAFRALAAATKTVKQSLISGLSNLLNTDLNAIFGEEGLLTKANATGVEKFAGGVAIAGAALEAFVNIVDAAKQGFANGGILGGIGAVGSIVGNALKDVPVVGPLVQGFSQAFTAIGALLTKSARNLADKFQKQFDAALQSLSDGESTLVETIAVVKSQRDRAIVELSGKKGGKAELDKLLPGFDSEIKNLLKQQQDIIKAFDKELQLLNLQSDVLAETATAWDSINEKVKEYIGAGGDAAKAAQFLELQVGKLRQQAVDELNSAEQQALQQMLSFNNLLKDRQKLIDDFRKREFDLIAGGAIERRGAGSVLRGRELAALREQFQEQLTALDDQIRLETIKVEKTKEIFSLTNDIVDLKRRDEAFTLAALDAQISRWKQLQELVRGISSGGQSFLSGIAPTSTSVFNVVINAGAGADGAAIADSFSREMESRIRQGLF